MNFGNMDRKIMIQSPPTAKDDGGELSGSWTLECSPWAMVKHDSSSESNDEGTEAMADVLTFTIRHRPGITSGMRVVYGGDTYEILGIKEVGREEYLELSAVHRTSW